MNAPKMLTITEAIKQFGFTKYSIEKHIREGRVPHVRIGRRRLVNWEHLNNCRSEPEYENVRCLIEQHT